MTTSLETVKCKYSQAAVSALFQRIFDNSPLSQTELEPELGIVRAGGSNYGRYRNGKRALPWWRFLQIVRIASAPKRNWLTQEDLRELGLEDAARMTRRAADIKKEREAAVRLFLDGQDRMLNGLLPMYVHGSHGQRMHREPQNDAEMAREYARWIAEIAGLGGTVTHEVYLRGPSQADLELAQWEASQHDAIAEKEAAEEEASGCVAHEFLRELEHGESDCQCGENARATIRDALIRALDGTAPREAAALEAARDEYFSLCDAEEGVTYPSPQPRPAHHPDNVQNLTLWFGGRDYSPHPYQLVDKRELTLTRGDPIQGLGGLEVFSLRKAARQRRAKTEEVQCAKIAKRAIARATRS